MTERDRLAFASGGPDSAPDPPELPPVRPLRLVAVVIGTLAILVIVGFWSLTRGAPNVSTSDALSALIGDAPETLSRLNVVVDLRLPRLVMAILVGAGLGIAGTIMQDALRNPLADPGLLGITEGAALVMAIALLFPTAIPASWTPVIALIAGLVVGTFVVSLASVVRDPVRLILVGVVLAVVFATMTTVVIILAPVTSNFTSQMRQFLVFTSGSVVSASWERLGYVWPWCVVAIPIALLCGRSLNLLQLGEDMAVGLGMNVRRTRLLLFYVAIVLTAPAVAIVGPIAFVALLSPHITRFLLRTSNAHAVLPVSALVGALIVVCADTLGRLLFFPNEIPAGIWTIVIAAPVAIKLAGPGVRRAARSEVPA